MPNKLFVHVEPENKFVGPTDFVELCRLHLDGGHSYLVQAKGLLGPEAGVFMDMRLDVHGPSGTVVASTESSYININQQFVLTAAAKLPAGGGGTGAAANPPGQDGMDQPPAGTLGLDHRHRPDSAPG
jgi:hypothetical protein